MSGFFVELQAWWCLRIRCDVHLSPDDHGATQVFNRVVGV